jgi:type VI protein secretion system component Hcp
MAADSTPTDLFLHLYWADGSCLEGETSDEQQEGAIEINNFSLSLDKPEAGGGTKYGKKFSGQENEKLSDKQKALATGYFELKQERLQDLTRLLAAAKGQQLGRQHSLRIDKLVDKSSPYLFSAFCKSQKTAAGWSKDKDESEKHKQPGVFQNAVLVVRKATGAEDREFLMLTFSELNVKHYELKMSGEGLPSEGLTFSFDKLTLEYRSQHALGTLGDMKVGKPPQSHVTVDFSKDAVPKDE